jgi:hypothetical protein
MGYIVQIRTDNMFDIRLKSFLLINLPAIFIDRNIGNLTNGICEK